MLTLHKLAICSFHLCTVDSMIITFLVYFRTHPFPPQKEESRKESKEEIKRERERVRERERERERERQTDRQTDRQRQTETDRDRERQRETERDTDRETETQRERRGGNKLQALVYDIFHSTLEEGAKKRCSECGVGGVCVGWGGGGGVEGGLGGREKLLAHFQRSKLRLHESTHPPPSSAPVTRTLPLPPPPPFP